MGIQAEAFLTDEGDAFYERNRDKPRLPDPVFNAIGKLNLRPKNVLEMGCGDGWRLACLKAAFGSECQGIDTSDKAVGLACKRGVHAIQYDRILTDRLQDLIIFGFCLYVVDRQSLLKWASDADEVLKDGGHIIIHDFFPEYPYRRPYTHKVGLWSYKMDYSKLWLAHPGYKLVRTDLFGEDDNRTGVAVLQKDFASAFPVRDI